MSIDIGGELLVPEEMTSEQIAKLEKAIESAGLGMKLGIQKDTDRAVKMLFAPSVRVQSIGLKLPDIEVSYTCDLGGGPFHWGEGYSLACAIVRGAGYTPKAGSKDMTIEHDYCQNCNKTDRLMTKRMYEDHAVYDCQECGHQFRSDYR